MKNKIDKINVAQLACLLDSNKIAPSEVLRFDLAEALRKKPDHERPDWVDDPVALDQHVKEYAKLFMLMATAERPIVPTKKQDDWGWHIHMLSPQDYFPACQQFGGIIGHNGGFGLGEGEEPILKAYFEDTKRLWKDVFGEEHPANDASNFSWCGTADCLSQCFQKCSCRVPNQLATCFKEVLTDQHTAADAS